MNTHTDTHAHRHTHKQMHANTHKRSSEHQWGEIKYTETKRPWLVFTAAASLSLTTVYLHTLINGLCVSALMGGCVLYVCVCVCAPLYMLHFRGHEELKPNFVFSLQVR